MSLLSSIPKQYNPSNLSNFDEFTKLYNKKIKKDGDLKNETNDNNNNQQIRNDEVNMNKGNEIINDNKMRTKKRSEQMKRRLDKVSGDNFQFKESENENGKEKIKLNQEKLIDNELIGNEKFIICNDNIKDIEIEIENDYEDINNIEEEKKEKENVRDYIHKYSKSNYEYNKIIDKRVVHRNTHSIIGYNDNKEKENITKTDINDNKNLVNINSTHINYINHEDDIEKDVNISNFNESFEEIENEKRNNNQVETILLTDNEKIILNNQIINGNNHFITFKNNLNSINLRQINSSNITDSYQLALSSGVNDNNQCNNNFININNIIEEEESFAESEAQTPKQRHRVSSSFPYHNILDMNKGIYIINQIGNISNKRKEYITDLVNNINNKNKISLSYSNQNIREVKEIKNIKSVSSSKSIIKKKANHDMLINQNDNIHISSKNEHNQNQTNNTNNNNKPIKPSRLNVIPIQNTCLKSNLHLKNIQNKEKEKGINQIKFRKKTLHSKSDGKEYSNLFMNLNRRQSKERKEKEEKVKKLNVFNINLNDDKYKIKQTKSLLYEKNNNNNITQSNSNNNNLLSSNQLSDLTSNHNTTLSKSITIESSNVIDSSSSRIKTKIEKFKFIHNLAIDIERIETFHNKKDKQNNIKSIIDLSSKNNMKIKPIGKPLSIEKRKSKHKSQSQSQLQSKVEEILLKSTIKSSNAYNPSNETLNQNNQSTIRNENRYEVISNKSIPSSTKSLCHISNSSQVSHISHIKNSNTFKSNVNQKEKEISYVELILKSKLSPKPNLNININLNQKQSKGKIEIPKGKSQIIKIKEDSRKDKKKEKSMFKEESLILNTHISSQSSKLLVKGSRKGSINEEKHLDKIENDVIFRDCKKKIYMISDFNKKFISSIKLKNLNIKKGK